MTRQQDCGEQDEHAAASLENLAEELAARLAARGLPEGMALLDLMRLEQHLTDDLATVRRMIAAVTRSLMPGQ